MQPPDKEKSMRQLSLSDGLAIERTKLANDRTLLSFIRTSLYFSIAGLSITSLLNFSYDWLIVTCFFMVSFFVFIAGFARFFRLQKKLKTGSFKNDKFGVVLDDEE